MIMKFSSSSSSTSYGRLFTILSCCIAFSSQHAIAQTETASAQNPWSDQSSSQVKNLASMNNKTALPSSASPSSAPTTSPTDDNISISPTNTDFIINTLNNTGHVFMGLRGIRSYSTFCRAGKYTNLQIVSRNGDTVFCFTNEEGASAEFGFVEKFPLIKLNLEPPTTCDNDDPNDENNSRNICGFPGKQFTADSIEINNDFINDNGTNVDSTNLASYTTYCQENNEYKKIQFVGVDGSVFCVTSLPGSSINLVNSDGDFIQMIDVQPPSSTSGCDAGSVVTDSENPCGFSGVTKIVFPNYTDKLPSASPTASASPTPSPSASPTAAACVTKGNFCIPSNNSTYDGHRFECCDSLRCQDGKCSFEESGRGPTPTPTDQPSPDPSPSPTSHPSDHSTPSPTPGQTTRGPTPSPTPSPTPGKKTHGPTPSPTDKPTGGGDGPSTNSRRKNIGMYASYRQAFLVFEKPFLEVVSGSAQQSGFTQMVTTVYWLGPPSYKLDDEGNIDTIVSRVIEYVNNPSAADPNQGPNNGVTMKFNPAGFASSWNDVLEYYESVIVDLDPNDSDGSQYRWSEAGHPLASIIEFEPSDFVGAVKARWEFDTSSSSSSNHECLQQLESDFGQPATPESFEYLYKYIVQNTPQPNPNPNPSPNYHYSNHYSQKPNYYYPKKPQYAPKKNWNKKHHGMRGIGGAATATGTNPWEDHGS